MSSNTEAPNMNATAQINEFDQADGFQTVSNKKNKKNSIKNTNFESKADLKSDLKADLKSDLKSDLKVDPKSDPKSELELKPIPHWKQPDKHLVPKEDLGVWVATLTVIVKQPDGLYGLFSRRDDLDKPRNKGKIFSQGGSVEYKKFIEDPIYTAIREGWEEAGYVVDKDQVKVLFREDKFKHYYVVFDSFPQVLGHQTHPEHIIDTLINKKFTCVNVESTPKGFAWIKIKDIIASKHTIKIGKETHDLVPDSTRDILRKILKNVK